MSLRIVHSSLEKHRLQLVLDFVRSWENEEDIIKAHTSGSTGIPKEITLSKSAMRASAEMTGEFFGFSSSTVLLCCLNPEFIAGKMMLVRALTFGCDLILTSPEQPMDYPKQFEVDFAAMVPLQVEKILQHTPSQLNRISTLIIGGAPVSFILQRQLATLKTRCYETFGMTETTSHIALKPIQGNHPTSFEAIGDVWFSQDDRGCLIIHAERLNQPELITNDVVELIDSRHFVWLGRADYVINSGGIKFHPEELERKLAAAHWPFRYFVAGIPDERLGQAICLITETTEIPELEFTHLVNKYEVPRHVRCLFPFSETSSGKINRLKTIARLG
jgi:o-succinylbenzoate---CoA ligase